MTDAAPAAPHHTLPVRFVGSGSEYFRIWIVNLLLVVVTLGIYYPFAKARRLRYFHGATEVGGLPLAFHADPWKMLRGHALAAAMLVAYAAAGEFSPAAGAVAFVALAALWPALWQASMRFRLVNTGWRGLRLRYTGQARQAYGVMALPIGAALALVIAGVVQPEAGPDAADTWRTPLAAALAGTGLLAMSVLMPLFLHRWKRLQHSHCALGLEQTAFSATAGSFYGLAIRTALVGAATSMLLGVAGVVGVVVMGLGVDRALGPRMIGGALAVALAYAAFFAIVGGYWTARLQNLVWNATASRHLRFESRLGARALARLWFRNAVLVVLTLGLYLPFAKVASARLRLEAVTVTATVDPNVLAAVAGRVEATAVGDAAGDLLGFDLGL